MSDEQDDGSAWLPTTTATWINYDLLERNIVDGMQDFRRQLLESDMPVHFHASAMAKVEVHLRASAAKAVAAAQHRLRAEKAAESSQDRDERSTNG